MSHKCKPEEGCKKDQHVTTLPASEEVVTFREPTMGEFKEFMGTMPILVAPSDADNGNSPVAAAAPVVPGMKKTLELVCLLSLKPKFTNGEGEQAEGERPLDGLPVRDVMHLVDEIRYGFTLAQQEAGPI